MPGLSLTFSLAEQNFAWTRSIGLLNLSVKMLEHLARHPGVSRLTLIANDTFRSRLDLPPTVETLYHNEANGRGPGRMFWDQWKVYDVARRTGNAWLFMPKGFVSFVRRCPVRLASYVPDIMFDYYERTYPGRFSRMEAFYLRQSVKAALRQSKVIFTCSEFTNSELRRAAAAWGITPPPLAAIGTGFSTDLKADTPKEDRILVLASPWMHKRTDLALQYMERWCRETRFTGKVDWVGGFAAGVTLPTLPGWELFERVPEKEYRGMVSRARALVYFTEYEGFGMPPVEAIVGGTCAVYSDIPATQEVMDGAGAPFRNDSYESFAKALDAAVRMPPPALEDWARMLLRRHNWTNGAEKIVRAMLSADEASPTS